MLTLPPSTQVFVSTRPTDMRRSFDGLVGQVRDFLGEDPLSGHLFVFHNRHSDRIKILWWDRDGLAIFYKRLEKGSYQFPTDTMARTSNGSTSDRDSAPRCEIRADELALLLEGIDLRSVKRRPRYQRPVTTDSKATEEKPQASVS